MNEKSVAIITFSVFGLFVYPLAIIFHQNFYADGAFFFARLLDTGKILARGGLEYPRYFFSIVTQFPTLFTLNSGLSDISILSLIYGACLYYTPFFCYVLSACLFLRKGLRFQTSLLLLMYILWNCFASLIISGESHLAAASFILTLSAIVTCDLTSFTTLIVLLLLALFGLRCYEFWAIYYLICLAFFIQKSWGKSAPPYGKALQIFIAILFLGGAVLNGYAIIFSKMHQVRDAMLTTQLRAIWPTAMAVCLFYGATILYIYIGSGMTRSLATKHSDNIINITLNKYCSSRKVAFAIFIFGIATCLLYIFNLPRPDYAYNLRILNLILPFLFSLSLLLLNRREFSPSLHRRILKYIVVPVVALTVTANFYQTTRWRTYTSQFFHVLQVHSGYIPVQDTEVLKFEFQWFWTNPTLSILLQAMEHRPVQTILFNPKAQWEPYGPSSTYGNAELLANRIGVSFLIEELKPTSKNSS
jgi:hypothetical protein